MNLYIDIGNANTKVNFLDSEGKEIYFSFSTYANDSVDTLFVNFPDELKNGKFTKVYASSVVPSRTILWQELIKKYFNLEIIFIEPPFKTGLKIAIHNPKEIGSDLVCLGAYASIRYEKAIVVNLGTATTFVIVENKAIKGVIIAPGIEISFQSLVNKASKLSDLNLSIQDHTYGLNTQESISLGVLHGHSAMIQGLVNNINLDQSYKLLISGGNSQKILKLLPEFEYVKEMTIQGIKDLAKYHEDKLTN